MTYLPNFIQAYYLLFRQFQSSCDMMYILLYVCVCEYLCVIVCVCMYMLLILKANLNHYQRTGKILGCGSKFYLAN